MTDAALKIDTNKSMENNLTHRQYSRRPGEIIKYHKSDKKNLLMSSLACDSLSDLVFSIKAYVLNTRISKTLLFNMY